MKLCYSFMTILVLLLASWSAGQAQPISFERHKIANIPSNATSIRIHPADLDNDGDQDIVTADALGGKLFWWESSGGTNPTFTKHQFASGLPQCGPFFTADVNGDGHLDILITSFTGDKVVWWRNDGNPDPTFIQEVLRSGFDGAHKVIATDLDQDGDVDVAAIARTVKQLRVFYNDGNLIPSWTQVLLSNSLSFADGLAYGDFNEDGLKDLVVANAGNAQVTIFKGSNTANNGFASSVIQTSYVSKNIYGADMNGDGNQDVLTLYQDGSLNKIGYLKNNGATNPSFSNKNVGTYDNSFSIFPADMDGDGNMDVLGGSNWEDGFRWWRNSGGTNPSFTSHLIEKNFIMAWTAKPADMDGDGDMDFVASTGWAIHWFENDLIEACELSITCKDPFNFPVTINGGTSVISGQDMVKEFETEDCNSNLTYTINGQNLLDFNCDDIGPQTLNIVATDEDGNSASCSIDIQVVDLIAPNITCPDDQFVDLDSNCEFEIPDYTNLASVVDNCSNTIIQTPSEGTIVNEDRTMILTVVDQEGQTSTCVFFLTVEDNEDPTVLCNNSTVEVDASGAYTLAEADVFAGGTDNCGVVTYLGVSPSKVNCSDVGSTVQVIVTGEDSNGNTSTCTANVMVKDNIQPVATCNNTSVQLDANGQYILTQADVYSGGTDNCGTVNFESMDPTMVDCNDAETTVSVTVTINDGNGNTNTCIASIMVDDNTAPVPVCTNTTISFNGEDDIAVSIDDLFDAASSMDNCGTVNLVSPTMDQIIDCDQIGNVIPVVVMVNDSNGNDASCTANITVEGLPCGFANTFGIGDCYDPNGNAADYDPNTEIFTLTSDGCAPAFPYTQDDQSYIQYELCGDGVIDVYIESLDGNGYAGIVMRESADAGARKVAISTNTINKLLKEVRVSPNYPAYPQQVFSMDKFWLRIERINGFFFKASASIDGISYIPVINQAVQMDGCVQTGLFVYSSVDGESVTAQFSNVTISEANQNLASTESFQIESTSNNTSLETGLSPNPARDVVNINLSSLIGEEVNIRMYDINGQLMTQVHYDEVENTTEVITLDHLPSGTYYVNVQTAQRQQTLKLVKQ